MSGTLTIIGGSVRAAAFSARRAGFAVIAADSFADADLRQNFPTTMARDPSGLSRVIAGPQPGDWLYTGGLENRPGLVDRLAALRPLLGNSGPGLRRVRSPFQLADFFARRGVAFPPICKTAEAVPQDGSWLYKPLGSVGGLHISRWRGTANAANTNPARTRFQRGGQFYGYFQQYIEGQPGSALYMAAAGRATLLGVTRQLIGTAWSGCSGFRYGGTVWASDFQPDRDALRTVGSLLAAEFNLVGLFGVDFVLQGGTLWPLEVNPRYTASVEVLERALAFPAVRWHVEACRCGTLPDEPLVAGTLAPTSAFGKVILYSRGTCTFSPELARQIADQNANRSWPAWADIPAPGVTFQPGSPIITALASADSEPDLLAILRRRAEWFYNQLAAR